MFRFGAVWGIFTCFSLARGAYSSEHEKLFPRDFIFSLATSSYQIEGAYNESGKGWSVWDTWTHMDPAVIRERENGDVACDSYHNYKEDVANLKEIGVGMYRFSISWSRVLPKGTLEIVNADGVQYYHNLIDELLANDIEPMVTMFHWDLPQHLQNQGGWLNANMVQYFRDYADFLFKTYGSKVRWWITLNEPKGVAKYGYGARGQAPALNLHGTGDYLAGHNMIKAHAAAYRLYQKVYRKKQKGKISLTLVDTSCLPKTNSSDDLKAVERCFEFGYGWFAHPIFSKQGDYSQILKHQVAKLSKEAGIPSRLPRFTKREIKRIRGSFDFLALHSYFTVLVTSGRDPSAANPSVNLDSEVIRSSDPNWPATTNGYVSPEGLRALLLWIKKQYNNPSVFITENGFADHGSLIDDDKIKYLESYLNVIKQAMFEDGCKIIGYTIWSLMDNFEWGSGYTNRFGMIHVDFNDPARPRTFKKSAFWYKNYIASNRMNEN